jgi:hypothetical protein
MVRTSVNIIHMMPDESYHMYDVVICVGVLYGQSYSISMATYFTPSSVLFGGMSALGIIGLNATIFRAQANPLDSLVRFSFVPSVIRLIIVGYSCLIPLSRLHKLV